MNWLVLLPSDWPNREPVSPVGSSFRRKACWMVPPPAGLQTYTPMSSPETLDVLGVTGAPPPLVPAISAAKVTWPEALSEY